MDVDLNEVRTNVSKDCLSIVTNYAYDFNGEIKACKQRLKWLKAEKERHAIRELLRDCRLITVEDCAQALWTLIERYMQTPFFMRACCDHSGKPCFEICLIGTSASILWHFHDAHGGSALYLYFDYVLTTLNNASPLCILPLDDLKTVLHTFAEQCYPD